MVYKSLMTHKQLTKSMAHLFLATWFFHLNRRQKARLVSSFTFFIAEPVAAKALLLDLVGDFKFNNLAGYLT